jgi:hypothetical protein
MAKTSLYMLSVAIALAMASGPADASTPDSDGDLARAISALDELEYDVAWLSLERALKSGQYGHDGLVLIYKLSGHVSAAFGNEAEAYGFFRRMLALQPRASLDKGLAPKIRKPYERAKKDHEDKGRLVVKFTAVDGEDHKVAIVVESDPLDMVAGVKVNGKTVELSADGVVEVPRGTLDPVVVAVTDRYGNHLDQTAWGPVAFDGYEESEGATESLRLDTVRAFDAGQPERAPKSSARASIDTDEAPTKSKPIYKRWYTWGAMAVGSAAVGAYFGMRANSDWEQLDGVIADSGSHSFDDAMALEDSGRKNQIVSNLGFGAAALFAAVAVVNVSFDF